MSDYNCFPYSQKIERELKIICLFTNFFSQKFTILVKLKIIYTVSDLNVLLLLQGKLIKKIAIMGLHLFSTTKSNFLFKKLNSKYTLKINVEKFKIF